MRAGATARDVMKGIDVVGVSVGDVELEDGSERREGSVELDLLDGDRYAVDVDDLGDGRIVVQFWEDP